MTTDDRLFILDDAGHTTEIRRPEYVRRASSQAGLASFRPGEIPDGRVPVLPAAAIAGLASLSVVGPGAAAQVAREVREMATPALVRMDAMEAVAEAALAIVATLSRWQDQQLSPEELALRTAVRNYQEVSS